jgi:hypothetical protein
MKSMINKSPIRHGISSMEALIALMLLSSMLSVSLSLIVRHGRLLAAERNYRLALDELSNQLERLTALPASDLADAMKQLKMSPFTAERLPDAELVGELAAADNGQRVRLRITSNKPSEPAVSMSGWAFNARPSLSATNARGRSE